MVWGAKKSNILLYTDTAKIIPTFKKIFSGVSKKVEWVSFTVLPFWWGRFVGGVIPIQMATITFVFFYTIYI